MFLLFVSTTDVKAQVFNTPITNKEGYTMEYKLMNYKTDLSDTTYVGIPLENFLITGEVINDDGFYVLGDFSWENPNYKIQDGIQIINIIFTTSDKRQIMFPIEINGINEPWRQTLSGFMKGYVVDCYEGTTLDNLQTPFWFYGENVNNVLEGELKYTCNEELTIGEHNATWLFTPYDTTYKSISGDFVINVLKNVDAIDTTISLSANGLVFENSGMTYDININNKVSGSTYSWKSSNTNVATVSSSTGFVKAISNGSSVITCTITLSDNDIIKLTTNVTVGISADNTEDYPTLSENDLYLSIGEKFDLEIGNKIVGSRYRYKSLNTTIAKTTSLTGIVTALSNGNTKIRLIITAPDKKIIIRDCDVTVE
jgi:hypothetical protein